MAKEQKIPRLTRAQIAEGLEQIPLDTVLLGTRTESRLTPKQREFARQLALGKSKAQAYRESYNSKGKPQTQAADGWKLAQRPEINQIKEAYQVAIEAAKQRTPAQLRELVIHSLTEIAIAGEKESNRIAALKLLGTVSEVAAFTERKEVTSIRKSEDVRAALLEKLRTITGQAEDAVIIPAEESADSLLEEIQAGETSNDAENGRPASDADDPDQLDPTGAPPPTEAFTTLSQDLHSVPHSGTSDNSISHSERAAETVPSDDDAEIIGLDVDVSSHIAEVAPIVAEKVPAEDPTTLDIETPPVDGTN